MKLGGGPSDRDGAAPGGGADGDLDGAEQGPARSTGQHDGQGTLDDDLRWFMELTNQMTEQNAAGVIDAEQVDPSAGDSPGPTRTWRPSVAKWVAPVGISAASDQS